MEHMDRVSSDKIPEKYFKVPKKGKKQFVRYSAVTDKNGLTQ
jgi:hypothetical protein